MRLNHKTNKLILLLFFLLLAIPVTFYSDADFGAARDEMLFHYPQIKDFTAQLPHLDLVNYHVTQTPLYHILMSLIGLLSGDSLLIFRTVNLLISLICISLFYVYFSARYPPFQSLFSTLTIALSPFFFGPSTRLMTDNSSLLWIIMSLILLDSDEYSARKVFLLTVTISCAVATRQVNIWLVPFAWLGIVTRNKQVQFFKKVPLLIILLFPVIILSYFIITWRGLSPPRWEQYRPQMDWNLLNINALIFAISLLGAYSLFHIWQFIQLYKENNGKIKQLMFICALALLFLLVFPYNVSQKYSPGPLDQVLQYFPSLFSISIPLYLLFPSGCFIIYVFFLYAIKTRNWILLWAFLFWLGPNICYPVFYQRYYESFILFFVMNYYCITKKNKLCEQFGPILLLLSFICVDIIHHLFYRIS